MKLAHSVTIDAPVERVFDCWAALERSPAYSGSIPDPSGVVLYSGGFSGSAALAGELVLTVRQGSATDTCASFTTGTTIFSDTITQFDTLHTGYGSGVGTWDPSSTAETRAYQLEISLPGSATADGESVTGLTFTWEVQS